MLYAPREVSNVEHWSVQCKCLNWNFLTLSWNSFYILLWQKPQKEKPDVSPWHPLPLPSGPFPLPFLYGICLSACVWACMCMTIYVHTHLRPAWHWIFIIFPTYSLRQSLAINLRAHRLAVWLTSLFWNNLPYHQPSTSIPPLSLPPKAGLIGRSPFLAFLWALDI